MSRFNERLEQDLGQIADKATPSPTAWDAIQSRIAEQADQPEMEIIMLQPDPLKTRRPATWVLAAAAAVVVIVAGLSFVLFNDDPDTVRVTDTTTEVPTPTTVPSTSEPLAPTTTSPTSGPGTTLAQPPAFDIGDDERALVEAFVAYVNAGDVEAVVSLLGADAEFGSTLIDMNRSALPVAELGDRIAGLFSFLDDLNAQISIDSCTTAGETTFCFGEYTDDVVEQVAGLRTNPGCGDCTLTLTISTDGPDAFSVLRVNPAPEFGVVGGFTESIGGCVEPCRPTPWVQAAGYLEFLAWIDEVYPDERALLMDDNIAYPIVTGPDEGTVVIGAFPRFTPEANALWVERIAEWTATN